MLREIADDEIVTQYRNLSTDPVFRTRPRPDSPVQNAMSVTLGERDADMAMLVRRHRDPQSDTVRHARVVSLREAGFQVRHQPSAMNPDHASVECAGEWDSTVEERFDACVGEVNG